MSAPQRSAALILRHSPADLRVFLARRRPQLRQFGGLYAFPGGGCDAVDGVVARRSGGLDADDAERRSALLREVVEELGIDLRAGAPEGGRVALEVRRRLSKDPSLWIDRVDEADLQFLGPAALRLITPDFYGRRFDTAFYLVDLAGRVQPELLGEELDAGEFATAAQWLGRFEAGEILLAPPVVHILSAIEGCPVERWGAALRRVEERAREERLPRISCDPMVRLLPLRTPTLPPARHTNAYLVGREKAYLVDPATPHADEQARLFEALDRAAEEGVRVGGILLTHAHADHVGAVEAVRRRHFWPVMAHAAAAERLRGRIAVDRVLRDGEELDLGAPDTLRCVHTPGHAPGHLCFFQPRLRLLIAGDMVSTLSSILIHPDDGDLDLYEASLQRLIGLRPRVVHPAHGPFDARGERLLVEQLEHRRRRTEQVREALAEGAATIAEITSRVYPELTGAMRGYAASSVRSILASMRRKGWVEGEEECLRLR